MKLAIGSDHVGFELKPLIIDYLEELGHEVTDFGPFSTERTDYPIYGKKVAEEVAAGHFDGGVLICGTGVGISISANKVEEFVQSSVVNLIRQNYPKNTIIQILWHSVHVLSEVNWQK